MEYSRTLEKKYLDIQMSRLSGQVFGNYQKGISTMKGNTNIQKEF